jgi:hypothetical protein
MGGLRQGGVSELADERDLGSRGAIRESSNLSFPTCRPTSSERRVDGRRAEASISRSPGIGRKWLSGRASPCQGEGREFESRLPLLLTEGLER